MQIELTQSYVEFQAQTKLLDLAVETAESRSLAKVSNQIAQATKIRLWLKALQYSFFLEKKKIDLLVYCLNDLADANAIPFAPLITTVAPPTILVGIKGDDGVPGAQGPEGGGTPFSKSNVSIDTIIDSFDISLARAAKWRYTIYGTGGQRVGSITGGWSFDGLSFGDDGDVSTDDIYGSTDSVILSVVVSGTTASLFAVVTSGTWTITGTRVFIPSTGVSVIQPTSLADGTIWIGNASNIPEARFVTGDITISNTGVATIPTGTIINADISGTAGIAVTKLAAMAVSLAVVTDPAGFLTTVPGVSPTKIGFLSNVTSDIQVQLDSKLSAATGAISTVVSTNLTVNRAVISNAFGKIAVSNTTDIELGFSSGVTSPIQPQINAKVSDTGDIMFGPLVNTTTIEAQGGIRTASSGVYLKTIVIDIGDWDMDTATSVTVVTGIGDPTKIRSVSGMIRADADATFPSGPNFMYPLPYISFSGVPDAWITNSITPGSFLVVRLGGGTFDNTDFDATIYNRGWLNITYEV